MAGITLCMASWKGVRRYPDNYNRDQLGWIEDDSA